MNLWAMPTEINSQALRAWGILRGGGVWQSGRRIRTAFGLNYSQALRAWWLRPVSLRSPQGFTFDTSGRSPEERKALIALSRPLLRSPQGFTLNTSGRSPEGEPIANNFWTPLIQQAAYTHTYTSSSAASRTSRVP